ncbi:hypothetical protein ABN034_07300 [Actinopolymorpha sp. B11F2]|uniref:hypothetical protein n=1 Tax=Actinopolymorpha sp. B11F2 TaxID=3160862 RepID=UPI0032E38BAA
MGPDLPPSGRLPADELGGRPGDGLADDLRVLGRTIHTPAPDGDALAAAVMERLAAEPAPTGHRGRLRAWAAAWTEPIRAVLREPRRVAVVAATALVVALALTPPVRATVAEWFGFGVVVRPGPRVPSAPPPPSATGSLTMKDAARLVRFIPVVPRALGTPDKVDVASDGRLLSLSWSSSGGTRRLDEFEGQLAPMFVKSVSRGEAEYVDLDGRTALWFPTPHEVALIDEAGAERTESARPAGPTLVWESSGVTLRLEGVADKRRAIEIARSAS